MKKQTKNRYITVLRDVSKVQEPSFSVFWLLMYKTKICFRKKCNSNNYAFGFMSRIDYANSLYFGLSGDLLDRLQRILNYAARLTCRTKGLPSTTGLLKSLNWLPVRQRILYKLSVLTFRCVHGSAPSYLSNLL